MNKHSTPIISAVRRMHAEDDKAANGRDPYNSRARAGNAPSGPTTPAARDEAGQILACYETPLSLQE